MIVGLGHGIEWARLITQWALSTYKEDKAGAAPYIEAAENLYNRAVADAWNADGEPGICYTTDWNGKPVVVTMQKTSIWGKNGEFVPYLSFITGINKRKSNSITYYSFAASYPYLTTN